MGYILESGQFLPGECEQAVEEGGGEGVHCKGRAGFESILQDLEGDFWELCFYGFGKVLLGDGFADGGGGGKFAVHGSVVVARGSAAEGYGADFAAAAKEGAAVFDSQDVVGVF